MTGRAMKLTANVCLAVTVLYKSVNGWREAVVLQYANTGSKSLCHLALVGAIAATQESQSVLTSVKGGAV